MNIFKTILLLFFITSLVSCVMDSTKSGDQESTGEKELIKIDADIEDDFNLALSYLKKEDYSSAIELLEKIIAVEKRVPSPFINLGMAYSKKGDVEKAEKNLLMAVKIELTHPIANNQLGLLYRKKGEFDNAKKAYTNVLTDYPDNLPILKNLGILCELYMRDLACALTSYEHYLSLRPDDKVMKIWVADLRQRVK